MASVPGKQPGGVAEQTDDGIQRLGGAAWTTRQVHNQCRAGDPAHPARQIGHRGGLPSGGAHCFGKAGSLTVDDVTRSLRGDITRPETGPAGDRNYGNAGVRSGAQPGGNLVAFVGDDDPVSHLEARTCKQCGDLRARIVAAVARGDTVAGSDYTGGAHVTLPDEDDSKPTVAVLILAAGRSERFGKATKQLAKLDGRPLVAHAVCTAQAVHPDRIAIVVGHDHMAVARAAAEGSARTASTDGAAVAAAATSADCDAQAGIEVVVNEAYASGQASSLRAGVAHLADVDVIVVLLADQPGIDAAVVANVADKVRAGAPVARARYHDGPGHPVAFGRQTFADLAQLTGDQGARQVLRNLDVVFVDVDANAPPDVDEPADLERLHRLDG